MQAEHCRNSAESTGHRSAASVNSPRRCTPDNDTGAPGRMKDRSRANSPNCMASKGDGPEPAYNKLCGGNKGARLTSDSTVTENPVHAEPRENAKGPAVAESRTKVTGPVRADLRAGAAEPAAKASQVEGAGPACTRLRRDREGSTATEFETGGEAPG